MSSDAAEEMVSVYGHARVIQYVEALPHQRNVRNLAGWLRRAIDNCYELDLPPADSRQEADSKDGAGIGEMNENIYNTAQQLSLAQDSLLGGDLVSDGVIGISSEVTGSNCDLYSSLEPLSVASEAFLSALPSTGLADMVPLKIVYQSQSLMTLSRW